MMTKSRSLVVAITIVISVPAVTCPVAADPFGEAIGGAIEGAIIGGIIGGGDGAAAGAALGGVSGYAAGGARLEERRRQEAVRLREMERAEWQRQQMLMQQQLAQQRQQQAIVAQPPQQARRQLAPAAPSITQTLVIETQKSLIRLGLNPGGVDGRVGPQTVSAITSYQQTNGLLETGQPSQELLAHMLRNGG